MITRLIRRDIARAWQGGGIALPVIFLLLVAALFPFAVGPDTTTLARTGGGMILIAALLASLLPIERLVQPDMQSGVLDQLAVRGIGTGTMMVARLVAHWLSFGPPVMLAAIPAAGLLKLDGTALARIELSLLAGTPGLAALALMVAALTASLRGGSALAGLLVLPLAVPLLIFGAGSLTPGSGAALKLLAACSLVLVVIAPVAGATAIRASRD